MREAIVGWRERLNAARFFLHPAMLAWSDVSWENPAMPPKLDIVNGEVSHWFHTLPAYRPGLPGDREADVCIVGAGYTGLWTAYYLKRADPSLRITILEARFAGFGASGRNGGWLSGLAPGDRRRMAERCGRERVLAWQRALNEAVDEVIEVAGAESIDAAAVKGGTVVGCDRRGTLLGGRRHRVDQTRSRRPNPIRWRGVCLP